MTGHLLITFATLLLEDKDFLALARIVEYSRFHYSTVNIRRTDLHFAVFIHKKDLVEHYVSALLFRETVDENFHASFHLELLASNINNCVHIIRILKVPAVSVRINGSLSRAYRPCINSGLQK